MFDDIDLKVLLYVYRDLIAANLTATESIGVLLALLCILIVLRRK